MSVTIQTRGEVGGGVAAHLQCPHCGHFSKSHAEQLSHLAAYHPSCLEGVAVGRLGNILMYQSSARLFHCSNCFYTSRDFAKLYTHIITNHCMDKREGRGEERGSEGGEERGSEGGEEREERGCEGGEERASEGEERGCEGGERGSEEEERGCKGGERGSEGGERGCEGGEKRGSEGEERGCEGGERGSEEEERGSEGGERGSEGGERGSEGGEERGSEGQERGCKGGERGNEGGERGNEGGEERIIEGEEVNVKGEEEEVKIDPNRKRSGEEEEQSEGPDSVKPKEGENSVRTIDGGSYRCLICGWRTKQKATSVSHVVRKHEIPKSYGAQAIRWESAALGKPQGGVAEEEEGTGLSEEMLKEEIKATAKVISYISSRYVCLICGWKTKLKGFATSHVVRCHNVECPYRCKDCPQKFFLPSQLQHHVRSTHRPGRYACPFCCFRSEFLGGFRRHCSRCSVREEEAGEAAGGGGGEEEDSEEKRGMRGTRKRRSAEMMLIDELKEEELD